MQQKFSKALMIIISLFLITSLGTPYTILTVRADTLSSTEGSLNLQPSGPYGPEGQPLEDVAEMVMPAVDTEKLLEEAQQRSWDTPPRFAKEIDVDVNPSRSGTWEKLDNGLELWRLRISSADAVSLNLGFAAYHMPAGGELYLYAPDYGQIVGPFTDEDNKEHGQLWTPVVEGAEIVLEVSLPASALPELKLELTSVNHGFLDFETAEKSGSCNRDVVCPEGNPWRSQIRSVARYTFSGSFLCTGALINNTAQNFRPFFLTANHCVSTSGAAASVVVYWNYECPVCRPVGSPENSTPVPLAGVPTQSGAILRATYQPSDMTLLELSSAVSSTINAYWSGWDRSGANAISAVAIHHPAGHEKRISFENQSTTITSYGGTTAPGNGTHIRITDWDLGTTEGGSSGSPLFDQNFRIIGQLHGGAAACGNDASDWYGRLFTSWTGGGTSATRLRDWLDPGNTGAVVLDGVTQPTDGDGFEPDNVSGQAKTINIGAVQIHNLRPAGDVDWVKFTLSQPSAVVVETAPGQSVADTEIALYDSGLTLLDSDDNGGTGSYSYINTCDQAKLEDGTYYIRVNEKGNNNEISSYTISVYAGSSCISTNVGDATAGMFPLYSGASARQSLPGANNGPVNIFNVDGNPFIAAERVIYKVNAVNTSFSEMMGLPDNQLDNTYWLPWYDNVNLDTQLRIANVTNSTTNIHVYIGGTEVEASPFPLAGGASTRRSFANVIGGPVEIVSDVPIVAAERLIYRISGVNTSFSEMMALPGSALDTVYHLPWYNNVDLGTQLRIGNASNATATVSVSIGGMPMAGSPFTIPADQSIRPSFANVNDGAVLVSSNVPIVVSERVVYKVNNVNTSFSEMMALPQSQVANTYWLPWYNNVDLDTQLRLGNLGNGTATIRVYIGGAEMPGDPFTLAAGASIRKSYPGVNSGSVRIVSDQPLVAAERVIYRVAGINTSFSEMMGLPNTQLDTRYWFPWYNNVDLDSQLRFGLP